MSRQDLETQHLSLYKGSLRGTWRKSFIGLLETCKCKKGAFLFIGSPQGNLQVISKGGFGQYVERAGNCTYYILLLNET
jgi:hypothetical protein